MQIFGDAVPLDWVAAANNGTKILLKTLDRVVWDAKQCAAHTAAMKAVSQANLDHIAKLDEQLATGVLSQEEYAAKRSKLFGASRSLDLTLA